MMKTSEKKNSQAPMQITAKQGAVWIIVMLVFISELFFYTWCRVQCRRTGYEIAQAVQDRKEALLLRENLKIELARLRSPKRIAQIAKKQLGLVVPDSKQVIIQP